jgi:hypothetical protein
LQPIAPALPLSQSVARSDLAEPRPGGSAASSAPLGTGQRAFVPEVPRTAEVLRQREEAKPPGASQPAPLQDVPRADTQQRIRAMQAPRTAAPPAASPRPDAGLGIQSGISGAAGTLGTELSANTEAKERTPEKWLEDIRKLKTEGKAAEFERELAEFKKRYPDYIVPEDLR